MTEPNPDSEMSTAQVLHALMKLPREEALDLLAPIDKFLIGKDYSKDKYFSARDLAELFPDEDWQSVVAACEGVILLLFIDAQYSETEIMYQIAPVVTEGVFTPYQHDYQLRPEGALCVIYSMMLRPLSPQARDMNHVKQNIQVKLDRANKEFEL